PPSAVCPIINEAASLAVSIIIFGRIKTLDPFSRSGDEYCSSTGADAPPAKELCPMTSNHPDLFELDPDRAAVLDHADRFARGELYPLSERMDAEEWWPENGMRLVGEAGFLGATIPEEF